MDVAGSNHILWQFEHQVAHHMDPNVPGKDNDCAIADPILRFHPAVGRRWWHKINHYTTFFGITFGFWKWNASDVYYYFSQQIGSVKFHLNYSDWVSLLCFKVVWISVRVILPWYLHGFRTFFTGFVIFMAIGAHYLENIFIVNHIQEELLPKEDAHWAERQVMATTNWCGGGYIANFISGGLNHQVEHHLFPSYSTYVYPVIAPIVEQTCKDFNLPYNNHKTFIEAWLACANYLRDLGSDRFDDFTPGKATFKAPKTKKLH